MAVTRKGKPGDLTTRRGGGNGRTWEGKQHAKVGRDAKDYMSGAKTPKGMEGISVSAGARKGWGKNVIDSGERGMSISASKNREDPAGARYAKGGVVKKGRK